MKISFIKAHANGNDFIILYNLKINFSKSLPRLVKNLCNRRTGIGADGLLIVKQQALQNQYNVNYYNADGTWETFCMNGLRCVAKYLFNTTSHLNELLFTAGDGVHKAFLDNNKMVNISLIQPQYISNNVLVETIVGHHINTGAQHFIVKKDDVDATNALELGKKIRFSNHFNPGGINVNFYTVQNNRIIIYTYEKGVESVMLSCASGSSAVIFHLSKKQLIQSPCKSYSLGGELIFSFDRFWKDAWVTGEAKILFQSEISLSSITPYNF